MKKGFLMFFMALLLIVATACGSDNTAGDKNTSNESIEGVEDKETNTEKSQEKDEDTNTSEEEVTEEEVSGEWETEVGETIENEGGSHTLIKRFDKVETQTTGTMILNISQINTISSKLKGEMAEFMETDELEYIQIDMEVENTSEDTISFYADQATITTNTGEQLESDMWLSDHIDGEYLGAVKKSGSQFFVLKNSKAQDIEWVRIVIDAPIDENWDAVGEKLDFKVEL